MAIKYLKKLLGDGLAGLDKSHGTDRLYEFLAALTTQVNDLTAQFNQLRTDYNASTTPTTATAVAVGVGIE